MGDQIEQEYPYACYVEPSAHPAAVLFITVTPDTYHGTRAVTNTSTTTSPTDSTVNTTTTATQQIPYSVDYGIYTLMVERVERDSKLSTVQTFRQKGLYSTIYGIPLGGRGHHPAHALIEDAAKWLNAGGLTDPNQSSSLVPQDTH